MTLLTVGSFQKVVDEICKLRDNSPTLKRKGNEMNLSEKLTMKLNKAEVLIEQARSLVLQVIDEDEIGDGASGGSVDLKFDEMVDFISDIGYEVIMPIQFQEEEAERLAEIRALESRLAELKAGGY